MPPPPGVESNWTDPDNRAYQYYIVGSIGTALATIFVLLRLYVRLAVTHSLWWDDCE